MTDSDPELTVNQPKTTPAEDLPTIDSAGPDTPSESTPDPRESTTSAGNQEENRQFGDYELLDEIARGGMGVVFRARQKSLNRVVALKMILAGHLASKADVDRFEIEARAAAKLDHPGIVPIYEIGNLHGQHFFSMAFVDGTSLSEYSRDNRLPAREAVELMVRIVDAVAFAHEQGVIHRDLKPANILLDQAGNPRITDFGLAKSADDSRQMTMTGQAMGTPGYMPPEQASGRSAEATAAADIYSLGAILYALLVGRPPFQAETIHETITQVIQQEPASPRDHDESIPKDLETICLKCLEKDPTKRFNSATELSAELRRYLAGEPLHSRAMSTWEKFWRWRKIIKNNKDVRLRSRRKLCGLPLVDVAIGKDREKGEETGHARGWVAIGDKATGVIAMGGFARGFIAYGKVTLGVIAIGAFSFGVFATGLTAMGLFTAGGLSIGYMSMGLVAIGYYSLAWLTIAKFSGGFWRISL